MISSKSAAVGFFATLATLGCTARARPNITALTARATFAMFATFATFACTAHAAPATPAAPTTLGSERSERNERNAGQMQMLIEEKYFCNQQSKYQYYVENAQKYYEK